MLLLRSRLFLKSLAALVFIAALVVMSMLDSSAVFEARCKEMGLLDEEAARLKAKGWNTFALLAFACSYTPGQADDRNLVRLGAIITGAGAGEPPEDRMPVVRRLFFEAYTLAAADLRSRVDRRDDDAPRKLALPERSQRNRDQAARLALGSLASARPCCCFWRCGGKA